MPPRSSSDVDSLSVSRKSVFALGDVTLNTVLSTLSLIYASYFLTQVAGLRPVLAGLVPLVGRAVDAFTDPAMGRISDLTRWRGGRRRPYFLIGALPLGASFAFLWLTPALDSQLSLFAYYAGVYCLVSLAVTVVSVPYLALLPEMALGYDERTSLNGFRNAGSILGIYLAISLRPAAEAFGGGSEGFAMVGLLYGIIVSLPWLAVWRASFERAEFRAREVTVGFATSLRQAFQHRAFVRLTAIYLVGRIAMDLLGALMILYFSYWIGRSEDFELMMFLFLSGVVLSLPFWLRMARGREKASIFIIGSLWWMVIGTFALFATPDWPRWIVISVGPLVGVGFAVVDLMPFAMLGDAIDEDDLLTGERREGLFNGVFMFVRKLGGAVAVFLVLGILDLQGFTQGAEQSESVRQTIRVMTGVAPAIFLGIGIALARGYPLTRRTHERIVERLAQRD